MPLIIDVEKNYNYFKKEKKFLDEFNYYLKDFVGSKWNATQ